MNLTTCFYLTLILSVMMSGCAAMELKPGAERVVLSRQVAPKSCKFKGNIVGSQGNFLTGAWTSSKNLTQGSINDIKNKAYEMGANYVVLDTHATGNTISGSEYGMSGSQTNVTMSGSAFHCPPKTIGLE